MSDLGNLLQGFLGVQKDLLAYHNEEIKHLEGKDFKAAEAAMKGKGPLVELYQAHMKALHERRAELAELGDAAKEQLVTAQQEFNAVMERYQHALDKAHKSTQRVLDLIKDAIVKHTNTSQFYGQGGSLLGQQAPRSFTVNKSA